MTITLNGTTGITLPNGSASAPAATGSDTDTGIVYGTNTVSLATGGTTAVTVDSSQNVGIGTSSPAVKLHVNGSGSIIRVATDTSSSGTIDLSATSTSAVIHANTYATAVPLVFQTASTERMRIDTSGNLLVGSTTTQNNNRLYVQSNNFMVGINGTNSSGEMVRFYSNGSTAGTISYTATTVAYNTSSDYRLKENIAPMTGALAKVSALKPVTYTWKVNGSDGQGFIAHELQAVVPECVTGEKDAVDADGNPVYQGIDTSFLVATLTAAIQELKAELDTVKTELATLKGTA